MSESQPYSYNGGWVCSMNVPQNVSLLTRNEVLFQIVSSNGVSDPFSTSKMETKARLNLSMLGYLGECDIKQLSWMLIGSTTWLRRKGLEVRDNHLFEYIY